MKKIIVLIIITYLFISGLSAQSFLVLDQSDLQPVEGALVFNQSRRVTATSGANGRVDASRFSRSDTLLITHVAYQPLRMALGEALSRQKILMGTQVVHVNEVVLSANKTPELRSDLAQRIEIVPVREIRFQNPQTSADLVQGSGKVFVQQSQFGGGSPVMRGMESSKVLLVIDGVRMNNAIYRSGHLQNIITIDPNMLDRVEMVFGPGSVIYGSDALGGVMHFYSKEPEFSDEGFVVRGSFLGRYSTAASEKSSNLTLRISGRKWAGLTSISTKNLGDLRSGASTNPFYPQWGKNSFYPAFLEGRDTAFINTNPNIQKNTGYNQVDLMQKLAWKPSESFRLGLNLQLSNSGNIPRYDRLNTVVDSLKKTMKYAEWYYGPQTRMLAALKADWKNPFMLANQITFLGAWQKIREDRIQRGWNKPAREYREEDVDVLSLNVDALKQAWGGSEFRYGLDISRNDVASRAYTRNIFTDTVLYSISSRYPDQSNLMTSSALYLTHNREWGKKWVLSQGVRLSFVNLESVYSDTMLSITRFPFDNRIRQSNSALTGSLGVVYRPDHFWRFAMNAASGFRAPNVDDVGKVNDSNGGNQLLVIPNPDLMPEYSYNLDLTVNFHLDQVLQAELTGFYTWLTDAVTLAPTTLNGQDSVLFQDNLCGVFSNQNEGKAAIYGVQGSLQYQVSPVFSVSSNLSWTYGRLTDGDVPLQSIPPVFGLTSFQFEQRKFRSEFYIRYNGWKRLEDYSPGGEDNLLMATENGNPAWYTLNLKTQYQLTNFLTIQAGLENILDVHYRPFASGVSAPGRNALFSVRMNF